MALASAGLPPPVLNAAAAEGAARGRDGAQEADDGQRLGVKRRLDGELASARVGVDDAKGGDTIMVDATHMTTTNLGLYTRFSLQRLSMFFASYSLWALYILENILEY